LYPTEVLSYEVRAKGLAVQSLFTQVRSRKSSNTY
jgi:hypothetical protein